MPSPGCPLHSLSACACRPGNRNGHAATGERSPASPFLRLPLHVTLAAAARQFSPYFAITFVDAGLMLLLRAMISLIDFRPFFVLLPFFLYATLRFFFSAAAAAAASLSRAGHPSAV